MEVTQFLDRKPGRRIEGYRNSRPRIVKVLGVGDSASAVVRRYGRSRGANVLAPATGDPDRPESLDARVDGLAPHAVVLVLQGQPERLPFVIERTAAMLSVVLIEPETGRTDHGAGILPSVRAVADLFVSTSDPDFVDDLVANLAS